MSAIHPHIIVSDIARRGTTLTMHMLHVGGVPCIGAKPDFEASASVPTLFDLLEEAAE